MPQITSRTGKPIVIADYDPSWPARFRAERDLILRTCLPDAFVRIEHIGSTAVPGLAAKPIIDIMPGVRSLDGFAANIPLLASIGYEYVPEYERPIPELNDPGMPFRRYFRKDVDRERAFHMHVVETGRDFWRDHQLFRNWLKYEASDRAAYESMKRRVAADYNAALTPASDINVGYTDRKSELINEIMARAKEKVSRGLQIRLVPYNPDWPAMFEEVRAAIAPIFRGAAVGIEHVGSTSVPGLSAKPTIDVAVGVRRIADAEHGSDEVQALGYRKRWNTTDWLYYSKIHDHGEHAVHIHVVEHGPGRWDDYIDFRNELRRDPQAVAAYEALKRGLASEFINDRLGYPEAKSGFVLDTIERARARR